MSDLIEREDAIKALYKYNFVTKEVIEREIRLIPSADTDLSGYSDKLWKNAYERGKADRPRGEWIYCEDEYGIDGYRCSNCGRHIPWDYQHKFINFIDDYHTCPFCDARMKGADDGDNNQML